MTVQRLAHDINTYCKDYKYFWASGLIKETLGLWRQAKYFRLLSKYARVIANHYLEE